MVIDQPFIVSINFPGDLEYIPSIRKFVSEILQVSGFSSKYAYRSEIIVDEICNNAVHYGCSTEDAQVSLECTIHNNRTEFQIKDQGGNSNHLERLRDAIHNENDGAPKEEKRRLGLEIVRMLSEKVDFEIDEKKLTSIHIVRKREDLTEDNIQHKPE